VLRFRRPRSPVHLVRKVTAAALVALALGLALREEPTGPAPSGAQATVPVVVAAADLAAGAVLTGADLQVVPLPALAVPDGVVAEVGRLNGQVLAGPLRRGEPVTDVRVVGPGLWSQVPSGQVAAPVRLADLAVATLLRPGDRVDVLAAAADTGDAHTGDAEVVAARALVVSAPAASAADPVSRVAADGSGLLVLAVPPDTARKLAGTAANSTLTVTLGPP
jgi:pilus assembly protein CpaB